MHQHDQIILAVARDVGDDRFARFSESLRRERNVRSSNTCQRLPGTSLCGCSKATKSR